MSRFAFPSIVHILADKKMGMPDEEYINQMGEVEYFYDPMTKSVFRHQANYSQALRGEFAPSVALIKAVDDVRFQYHYLTDHGDKASDEVLEALPDFVEVEIKFSDRYGSKTLKKLIDIPLND